MTFMTGLFIGLAVGGVVSFFIGIRWGKQSSSFNESAIEKIAAKIAMKQTDQLIKLADDKLSSKKELIDGTLKNIKSDMQEKLDKVEKVMGELGTSNTKIDERLGKAAETIKELNTTTIGLKTALASNSIRGQWGERMAEDVLRLSGLIEGVNYLKQKKLQAAGSKPDFTFILPQQLKLNMDVKFPFNNYQNYLNSQSEKEQKEYKESFIKDVKKRIGELQTRDYINPEDGTTDYVLLFVPNEQIFNFIYEAETSVFDEALKKKIILCSPISLYAILAVIRQAIDNFSVETTARETVSILGAFRVQWEKFKDQMTSVKSKFDSTQKSFDDLTGLRERQLDKIVEKVETLRQSNSPESLLELPSLSKRSTKNLIREESMETIDVI